MAKEHRSPGVGEGGGTKFETVRSGGPLQWASIALALLTLVLQAGCATGTPMGGRMTGSNFRYQSLAPPESPDVKRAVRARAAAAAENDAPSEVLATGGAEAKEASDFVPGAVNTTAKDGASARPRRQARRAGTVDKAGDVEGVGWPDGVGDGRPYEVPITLDYFQGFLVQAGVPTTAMPDDGRTLSPRQAMELLPHLLSTPVTLGNFGLRRMAAHLLLEVGAGGAPVFRDELHARMRRFSELLVLRPDGYLVKPTTGVAVQKAGEAWLADDGTLRAGRFEVGPFYAIEGGRLFPVDEKLEVPKEARPAGVYEPDDNPGLAIGEGAALAVVDMVEGLYRLVFYTEETLEGLAQLPGAVRTMYENAPELWEEFRHKPYAERVRAVSRHTTGVVLMLGTAGAGAAKTASWGARLGKVSFPLLSLTGRGELALRMVAVPVGSAVAVSGGALSTTYVLHMANTGVQGAGGGGRWPPVGGPGRWIEDTSSMSEQARDYQAQVTGAPKGWAYRVTDGDDFVDFDGFDPKTGTLLEAKARGYQKWFDEDLNPTHDFYEGLDGMLKQARHQFQLAGGRPIRWHVAEPRMVDVLRKYFDARGFGSIEVVYTQPVK